MLSDVEIEGIAESHVRSEERKLLASGNQLRLELVRHCDVDTPSGVYYTMRVVEPPGERSFGPGGFFVARANGALEEFGSGELVEAMSLVSARERVRPSEITPAVVKMLFRQRSPDAIPESPFNWGRLP